MAYQHSALTQGLSLTHPEMSGREGWVRLEMTSSWRQPAMVGEPQAVRNYKAQFFRSAAAEYKAAIEKAV